MINIIGVLGFNKYRYIQLKKIGEKFMFVSANKDNKENEQ